GDEAATLTAPNDSASVTDLKAVSGAETSVASINTGFGDDVARSNRGSRGKQPSAVAPTNAARPTDVAPSNTTYHQSPTTTKDDRLTKAHDAHTLDEISGDAALVQDRTRPNAR